MSKVDTPNEHSAGSSPDSVYRALRDMVAAAEAQGWDIVPDLSENLDRAREAVAALVLIFDIADPEA